jgi:hypothetical protein
MAILAFQNSVPNEDNFPITRMLNNIIEQTKLISVDPK